MAVYVDSAAIMFRGKPRHHLTADSFEELHAFCQGVGIKRCWYHASKRHPHYDVTDEAGEGHRSRGQPCGRPLPDAESARPRTNSEMDMTHHLVYVVGVPGVGKTTALRALATPSTRIEDNDVRWTLKPPLAFIGHYEGQGLEDSSNQGGDRVARHANLLSLEYWKRYILPNTSYSATILDGEMYLWARILEALQNPGHEFVDPEEEHDKNYAPGGRYFKTYDAIVRKDPERFPALEGEIIPALPKLKISCVHLDASPDFTLARRRKREATAIEGATINSDQHMKTAASKQRNFAEKFAEAQAPFFMTEENPLGYLRIDVENKTPADIAQLIKDFALS